MSQICLFTVCSRYLPSLHPTRKYRMGRIETRMDKMDARIDSILQGQIRLIQWIIGVRLTVIALTVTLVKLI